MLRTLVAQRITQPQLWITLITTASFVPIAYVLMVRLQTISLRACGAQNAGSSLHRAAAAVHHAGNQVLVTSTPDVAAGNAGARCGQGLLDILHT